VFGAVATLEFTFLQGAPVTLCSTINALASLLERVDTLNDRITHTHDSISQVAYSVPNRDELTASLAPITSSVRDLSHRVSTAPASHRPAPPPTNRASAPAPPPWKPSAPTPSLHPDFPRHDHATNKYYGNPEAFAKSHPTFWEASHFANGGYPAISTFLPGIQDPTCPWLTYAQVSAPPEKGKEKSSPQGVASLASPPLLLILTSLLLLHLLLQTRHPSGCCQKVLCTQTRSPLSPGQRDYCRHLP